MYTGDDGETHWEAISLLNTPEWTSNMATSHIVFREDPVGKFSDWHPAPRRQFVVILSGALEIGFSDGTKKVFNAGDARLVEDTTGKGHTTGVYGDQPAVIATIPLA
tara:strand:- start:2 stop:322 length:321 start_codon:yes stop_codon:yes gene_type:complete